MSELKRACVSRSVSITQADLPLSCPQGDERLWDAHPRVFLPIEETGESTCPYCGLVYTLDETV